MLLLLGCESSLLLLLLQLLSLLASLLVLNVLEHVRPYDQLLEIQTLDACYIELVAFKLLVEEISVHILEVRIAIRFIVF